MPSRRSIIKFSFNRKLLLAIIGAAAVAGPLVVVLVNFPRARAQSPAPGRQTAAGATMAFDVASVRANKSGSPAMRENLSQLGGYVTATNATLQYLIETAYFPYGPYGAPNTQFVLSGIVGWINSEHFDIEARTEGNPTVPQKQLMMRSLLEDRFRLVMHHDTRQLPIFALVLTKVGKIGPQLIPHADNSDCVDPAAPAPTASASAGHALPLCGGFYIRTRAGSLGLSPEARGITMEWLAANLSGLVGRLVVDRTGLNGAFDLTIQYTPDVGQLQLGSQVRSDTTASDPSAPPSIFTALQEQLGLKLDSQTGPVDVLVVDHAEEPSEN